MHWSRLAVIILFLAASAAQADTAGVFSEISGDVRFLRDDYYFEAAPGVEVLPRDMVETAEGASAQLDMADGTVLRIGPGSRLSLSEYELDRDGNVLKAGVEVVTGWLRFAVSKLHAGAGFRFETPTMTIGIRGTEGVIEAGDTQGGLMLEEGEVEVRSPEGADGTAGTARVRAGEYVERARGRPFLRPSGAPAAFQARMPGVFRQRLQRRAQMLQQRGLPPRQIRRMTDEDGQRYLKQHPHMRPALQQRLRGALQNNPERRKQQMQKNQQRRKKLQERQHRP